MIIFLKSQINVKDAHETNHKQSITFNDFQIHSSSCFSLPKFLAERLKMSLCTFYRIIQSGFSKTFQYKLLFCTLIALTFIQQPPNASFTIIPQITQKSTLCRHLD